MNNKAHLRPKDYDSNGDIIPMACKEEKGDLISRKWLTDAIRNRRTYLSYEDAKDVIDLIDNAPTVEAYPFDQVQELVKLNQQFAQEIENLKSPQVEQNWRFYYDHGYAQAKRDFERPQGEYAEKYEKILQIVEHWNDKSSSFVSACEAFEKILDVTKGGAEND